MRSFYLFLPFLLVWAGLPVATLGQDEPTTVGVSIFAREPAETLEWDARITAMEAARDLHRIGSDSEASGWLHERFQQHHKGLRVYGAHLLRHLHRGEVVLVNGRYYEDIDIDTTAGIGPSEAALAAHGSVNHEAHTVGEPELLIYPRETGPVLAYMAHVKVPGDLYLLFIDAGTGRVVDRWSDLRRQAPLIGEATGTWQDTKKMSVTQQSGTYQALDRGRPALIYTVDARGDYNRWSRNQINPNQSTATDSDNIWDDGAVVDAHVYAGWTYDYYFNRFGRRGLNGNNMSIVSYVHYWPRSFGAGPDLNNTFWNPTNNSVNYGDGDGSTFNYFSSALDIVVHELTHAVSQTSADFIYRDEHGALGESFSDIMALGAEFAFEGHGSGRQQAEWLIGEDLYINNFSGGTRALRSASNPQAFGHPDHYNRRYTGAEDNGGVHINSTIPTHAFYLFVQGGTNRTSGIRVGGIGIENIERAEKIFYRAFTLYLGPTSRFRDAREATIQSAIDLYGWVAEEVPKLTAAWDAVGVR
jgi:thermolysin